MRLSRTYIWVYILVISRVYMRHVTCMMGHTREMTHMSCIYVTCTGLPTFVALLESFHWFIYVTCITNTSLVHICDMHHSFIHVTPSCVWLALLESFHSFIYVTCITHSYVGRPVHSLTCVIWLLHMCDITHSYVWHFTHSYVWHALLPHISAMRHYQHIRVANEYL